AARRLGHAFSVLGFRTRAPGLRRVALHAPAGLYAFSAPAGKDDRHLETKTRLDRRARWNGNDRCASGLYGCHRCGGARPVVSFETLRGVFGLRPAEVCRPVLARFTQTAC